MKYKLTLIAAFIGVAIGVTAQTTAEEYDYLTKGYKEDLTNGRGVKKGYELKEIRSLTYKGCFADLKALYRIKDTVKEKAAYLIKYKNEVSDTEYLCYPNPKSEDKINREFQMQFYYKHNEDTLRRNIFFYGLYSLINWAKDSLGKDNKGNYEASFFGDKMGWKKYLQRSAILINLADRGAPIGKYNVYISFTVDSIGKITSVIADKDPGYGVFKEATEIVKNSPNWIPASINGISVSSKRKDTLTFFVNDTAKDYDDIIFTSVEIEAEFPGGSTAWVKYLQQNLNSNVPESHRAPVGLYTANVDFIVEKDGTISNTSIEKDPGYGTGAEAIRVIKNGPKWLPAIQNGHIVRYRVKQKVNFVVMKD